MARGCAHVLIYCILSGIPVNIPRLIFAQICNANFRTSNKDLSFGMLFTCLNSGIFLRQAKRPLILQNHSTLVSFLGNSLIFLASGELGKGELGKETHLSERILLFLLLTPPYRVHILNILLPLLILILISLQIPSHISCVERYNYELLAGLYFHLKYDLTAPTIYSHPLPRRTLPFLFGCTLPI